MSKSEQRQFDFGPFEVPVEQLLTPDDIFDRADEALLIRLQEDRRIEHKVARFSGDSLAEYLSMWANTSPCGGIIVSGQRDKKNGGGFEGCKFLPAESLNKLEGVGKVFCPDARYSTKRVSVTNLKGEPDFVVLFRVHYSENILVRTTNGKVFYRVADNCIEAQTPEEIRELQADKGEISFEQQPCDLKWPDEFDHNAALKYVASIRDRRNLSDELSVPEVLELRRLGKRVGGKFLPNVACGLLFANDPQKITPGCKIRFQRFEGDREGTGEKYNAVRDEIVEGNVPMLILQIARILESQLRFFSPINAKGKFFPIPEYPKLAWYEAIVNACVHRSYGNGMRNMPIFVKMFDDRLEIESPGPFMPHVNPDNIYDVHLPRNPALMDALFYLDYVKCAHEGTRRMRDTMVNIHLPPPKFSQPESGYLCVKVVLSNNIKQRRAWIDKDVSAIVSEAITAELSENEKRILNWTAEHGKVSISDANKLLQINWPQAQKLLLGLAQKRIFQYIRHLPYAKNVRDPKAYFRLRSTAAIPDGGFEYVVTEETLRD